MKLLFIISEIVLLIIAILFIAVGIKKKRHALWITGIILVLAGSCIIFWIISGMAMDRRHLSNLSFSDRIDTTFEEFDHPYDPCKDLDFDGPVRTKTDQTAMRHIMYSDFVLVYDPNMEVQVIPLTKMASPESFFSLTKAAYAIMDTVIAKKSDDKSQWMIQFTGISELDSAPVLNFVIGTGSLSFSCPNYFKISHKASISLSGQIYQYIDDKPAPVGTMSPKAIEGLTPDREFGIEMI